MHCTFIFFTTTREDKILSNKTLSRRQSSVQQSSSSSYSQQQSGQQSWQQASGSFNARQVRLLLQPSPTHLLFSGGWILSLQTDRCSSDPAELALVQRSVQPLPEHLCRQLQGASARCDEQGRPRFEHRSQKDMGRVFAPAWGGCWNRTESLCSRLPTALLPGQ